MDSIASRMQAQPALDLAESTFDNGARANVSAAMVRQEQFLQRELFQCTTVHEAGLISRHGRNSGQASSTESNVALLGSKKPDERLAVLERVLANPTETSDGAVAHLFASKNVTGRELQLIARVRPVSSEIAAAAFATLTVDGTSGKRAELRRSVQRMRAAGELLQAYQGLEPEQKEALAQFASNPGIRQKLREPFAPFQQLKPQGYLSEAIRLLDSNSSAIRDSGVRMVRAAPELMRSAGFTRFAPVFDRTLSMLDGEPLLACDRLQDYGAVFRTLLQTPATQIAASSFLINTIQDHPVIRLNLPLTCRCVGDNARGNEMVATFFTMHALETPELARLERLGDAAYKVLLSALDRQESSMPADRLRTFLTALSQGSREPQMG